MENTASSLLPSDDIQIDSIEERAKMERMWF